MTGKTLSDADRQAHWAKTSKLMWTMLIIWFVFSFAVHVFAPWLNRIRILGFPMGFYMAGQGALIVFTIQCFWNARAQERIDEEFGVSDE